jgi:hypothetical protein
MDYLDYIIPILAVTLLSAGWAGIQLLARRLGTKNHIDQAGSCGSGCTCSYMEDNVCHRQDNTKPAHQGR